jgi:hypothetical protein
MHPAHVHQDVCYHVSSFSMTSRCQCVAKKRGL